MPAPVFGLKQAYRPYKCLACGQINSIQTNHTDTCYADCSGCSWKCRSFAPDVSLGNPEGRCCRKHEYVGDPPSEEDKNPYAKEMEHV